MSVIINKLLVQRFDLLAKFIYIKFKEKKIKDQFHIELYREHIRTFNNFKEIDNDKNSENDFLLAFDNLIKNMKEQGYNDNFPIPLGKNKILENGAHRLMVSLFLKIQPKFFIKGTNVPDFYNYSFFIKRENFPLSIRYSDFMALECIKINPNLRSMIIYPNSTNQKNIKFIKNIINKYGIIYYEKSVKLNDNGLNNLIIEQYRGEDWIGGMFPSFGQGGKYERCKGNGNTHIILFYIEDINLEKLTSLKEECRKYIRLGKHSLHISDYQKDTFRISSSLLNENSLFYLNNGTCNFSNKSKDLLIKYFEKINNDEDYCITSSFVMELFNIRYAKDLDFIHKDNINLNIENISPHGEEWLKYYPKNKEEILYNPDNHFYFNGHKIISISLVQEMKNNRNEIKDIKDVQLIKKFLNKCS